ncbi:hypothetical protein CC78DRAFT_484591 [Lojkania enalia]|uniref:Uncharacterized protein n=1 Tax=Lojkania enalia TaxID=147567 RepID=A0A9P4NCW4_9PLEO|nr:hypothetical protein CC78DRAFT_484591 [Didymosphaeria enalia]
MAEDPGGNCLSGLTPAPIFDDAVYQAEALHLPHGQSEDMLDEQLVLAARDSGIGDPYHFLCPDVNDVSTAMSTMTVDSELRSSMSMHSRESQSTGITSHPSRTSKDGPFLEQSPTLRAPQPAVQPSHSLDYYDAVMSRLRPSIGHRHSSSSTSATNSILSAGSSISKLGGRKRSSGIFSMFKRDTSACTSRAHQNQHFRSTGIKLECGHSLSKYEICVHIQDALNSREHVVPNCCGKPLPRAVLATVLTEDETDLVTADALRRPDYSSHRDSGYGEEGMSPIDRARPKYSRSPPTVPFPSAPNTSRDMARETPENLNMALIDKAFITLRAERRKQFQGISSFESNQRKALSAFHQWSLGRLASRLETTREQRTKQHALELERLDESQIMAEHDLRKAQAQEAQNVATALKYMEAYCSGTHSSRGEGKSHTVTDEDRKKLARQHLVQQNLPHKHESAINVLRAKQEKDAEIKRQKQAAEIQQLEADVERDVRAEEAQFAKDEKRLEAVIEARRKRVGNRWDLKMEMWKKEWENRHKSTLHGPLPQEEWPESTQKEGPVDPSSSLALLYIQVTG